MAQRLYRLPAMWEIWVRSLGQEDPLEKEMATHSVLLPGESHAGRSLAGYSPWGRKESDTTERLHFHFKYGIGFHFVHSVFLSKLFLIHAYQFLMNLLGRL